MSLHPSEKMFAYGPCYSCGINFDFDPESVPSISIDPETNLPPDVNANGERITPDPEALQRAITKPICPDCRKEFERKAGRKLWR